MVTALKEALIKVADPRHKRGVRYPFSELLLAIVCAVFSGAKTLTMITELAQTQVTADGLFPDQERAQSLATIHRAADRDRPGHDRCGHPRLAAWPHTATRVTPTATGDRR
jgi:hypothetical protein